MDESAAAAAPAEAGDTLAAALGLLDLEDDVAALLASGFQSQLEAASVAAYNIAAAASHAELQKSRATFAQAEANLTKSYDGEDESPPMYRDASNIAPDFAAQADTVEDNTASEQDDEAAAAVAAEAARLLKERVRLMFRHADAAEAQHDMEEIRRAMEAGDIPGPAQAADEKL